MTNQQQIDHAAAHVRDHIISMINDIKRSIERNEGQKHTWASIASLNRVQVRVWEICKDLSDELELQGYSENE